MEFTGIFTILILLLVASYGFLILRFTYGLFKQENTHSENIQKQSRPPLTKVMVSVIIPVRNEIHNINRILNEIRLQDYPADLLEAIVTDDFSEDHTCAFVEKFIRLSPGFPVKLIVAGPVEKEKTGKKRAIERAIQVTSGDLILCTDADTRREPHWISSMVEGFEKSKAKMILGPVMFENERNLLQKIQSVEFIGLMGVTAGSALIGRPVMCNGANLAYTREAFREVGGFIGNEQFTSGDDQFLMSGILRKYGNKAICFQYDRSALVCTEPERTLSGFLHQRIRWVSKGRGYRDPFVITVAGITYFTQLFLLAGMLSGFWLPHLFLITLSLWIVKLLLDYPLVYLMARFLDKKGLLGYYFIAQAFQLFYMVGVGLAGFIFPFNWKGRTSRR
ncbi:MAG: glycosyltransferase [Saccharofermentanaceae bacterium]|jgi:cellulose synthase/poly-beta-1,6-N-acetylglucosamine synthase-like glycosyltransferase|nr:glycosyltransferase [Bacteroidales bacterium]